ncbi:MAG: hypothetical protein WA941_18120 [Nitrososphaeraceae archaeon]
MNNIVARLTQSSSILYSCESTIGMSLDMVSRTFWVHSGKRKINESDYLALKDEIKNYKNKPGGT